MKYEFDFYTERLKWSWHPDDLETFLGGTQEWLLHLSKALKNRGHGVNVWWDGDELNWNGVSFRNRRFFDRSSQVLVTWNAHEQIHNPKERFSADKFILWTQHPELPNWNAMGFGAIDAIIASTHWQKALYETQLEKAKFKGVSEKIKVHYPGLDPEEFDPQIQVKRDPNLAIYASSWDRGLNTLIGSWPTIKRKFPKMELVVTYSPSFMSKITNNWEPIPKEWRELGIRFEERDRKGMGRLYGEASYLLYPCQGVEMFCLTSWKAQQAGAIAINTDHMALRETTVRGVKVPLASWCDAVLTLMGNASYRKELLKREMSIRTWDKSAEEFEEIVANSYEKV